MKRILAMGFLLALSGCGGGRTDYSYVMNGACGGEPTPAAMTNCEASRWRDQVTRLEAARAAADADYGKSIAEAQQHLAAFSSR
jgi:hypothetical protein